MYGMWVGWGCGVRERPLKRDISCRMTQGGSGSEWSW